MITKKMIWDGQGPVYFGKYDPINGTPEMGYLTNLLPIGCGTSSFVTSPKIEYDTLKETCSGQRLDLSRRIKGKSLDVKLTMLQFDAQAFARAFFSELLTVDPGSQTGEKLPANLSAGEYFFLKNTKASAVVLTDSNGTPVTLVAGTHYKLIDADQGIYQVLDFSTLTTPINVAYSNDTHVNVAAMTSTKVSTGVLFTGKNQDGDKGRVIIPQADLNLDGDFGWISDTATPLTMSGPAVYSQELDVPGSLFGPYMQVKWMPAA